jgi:hypothetical protein
MEASYAETFKYGLGRRSKNTEIYYLSSIKAEIVARRNRWI